MKEIVKKEFDIGSDAKGEVLLGVEASALKAQVSIEYPIEKIIEPATKAVDSLLDKLEQLIPGDWDKPFVEKAKAEFKEELLALLSE